MTHRRQFTAEFKAQVVLERLSGAKNSAELCREHQIASSGLADGKAIFLMRAVLVFASAEPHNSHEATRVAEVERPVGRLTLAHDLRQQAPNIVPQRSRPNTREPTGAAKIIPCAKSAECWHALAAALTLHRAPEMRQP
jgi:transposase